MKIFRHFLALTLALFALSIVQVNAQAFSDSKRPSAATLEQQVFRKIIGLDRYGVFDHIAFQVNGGEVTLTGKVISLGLKSRAESAVKRIPGVTRVNNQIEDLPPSPFDDSIRRQTLRAFADKGLYMYLWEPNPSVRIIVDRGRTTLEGYVSNRGDYNLMNILANGVPGAFSVENRLIVGKQQAR
jgi:osmotically-inducible protein OsmY